MTNTTDNISLLASVSSVGGFEANKLCELYMMFFNTSVLELAAGTECDP